MCIRKLIEASLVQLMTTSAHLATARASDSCLMLDCVRVINFIIIIIFYTLGCIVPKG